jgi:parallel beta-helix repeat protein
MKRIVFCTMLTLLLACAIFFAFNVKPAVATAVAVYINSDGSVSPSSAPISSADNVTYTFTGNVSYPTYYGIVVGRSNIVINGNGYTVQGNNSANGLSLTGISNVTIKNTNVQNFQNGIMLYNSSNNMINGNNPTSNSYCGIFLYSSNNNTVSENNATTNTYCGILLFSSSNYNIVSGNTATNNSYCGIYLDSSSSYNSISGNTATANAYHGILLYSSASNTVSGNNASANSLEGIYLDSSSSYNIVSGNTAIANQVGIMLLSSSNNTIRANTARSNVYQGIEIDYSNYDTVDENTVVANSQYGILFEYSMNNSVYHNNFINTYQTGSLNSTSTWDNGYPSGGNYWSDYSGTDSYRGYYQNITGSDGIGDTPHVVVANSTDRYPLMGQFGSSTSTGLNVTVFPSDDVGLIFQNVTAAGLTTVNEIASFAVPLNNSVGEYYDVRVGAKFSGNVTVRLIFDGSNMTQDQKNRLQLMQFTLPGDITGPTLGVPDGKVDIRDIAYVAKQFGTNNNSSNWNPMADLTGPSGVPDGKVDIRDIAYVAKNFGATSNWVNITSSVDTASNVIYGITTHFSVIGIHQD